MTTTRPRPKRRSSRPKPHPAIARRRREVRGIPERATLVMAGLAGVACAGLGYWLATGPALTVHGTRVSGYERPDAPQLTAAVEEAGGVGGSLLSPPIGAIRRQAVRFPWVADITLARDWPLGLVVQVIEAEPLVIGTPRVGGRVLINDRGQVMGPAGKRSGLPRVLLPGRAPAVGATVPQSLAAPLQFIRFSRPETAARLRSLQVVDGRLTGRLLNGPQLVIGAPTRLRDKATALQAVLNWATAEAERDAAYIDVSVPERPALGSIDRATQQAQLEAASAADPPQAAQTGTAAVSGDASVDEPAADPPATETPDVVDSTQDVETGGQPEPSTGG